MAVDDVQRVRDAPKDLLHRQHEGMDGAFHAFEQIHPHEMHQLVFAVDLLEYALTTRHAHIITFLVGATFLGAHIAQWRIQPQG